MAGYVARCKNCGCILEIRNQGPNKYGETFFLREKLLGGRSEMDGETRTIAMFVHGVNLKISGSNFENIRVILNISGSDFQNFRE